MSKIEAAYHLAVGTSGTAKDLAKVVRPQNPVIALELEQVARNMGKTLKSDFLVRFSGMPVYTFPGIGGGYLVKGSY